MILIAVDGGGCHSLVIEISERRYNRPEYMKALYNSIEMVFKKLKWHREKKIITITEVNNGRPSERVHESKEPRRAKAILENDESSTGQTFLVTSELSAYTLTDKPGGKTV